MSLRQWLDAWGPAYWLTRGAGWLAKIENPVLKNRLIDNFIKFYNVDMTSTTRQYAEQYQTFEDFFTRELKPNERNIPSDHSLIISPVDGSVATCGVYSSQTLIQFKQTTTNLERLTGSNRFGATGQYAIIYLSPRDYHRVHTPFEADLVGFSRLGSSRYSVNPKNHQSVHGLYERNVRVNSIWRLPQGEAFFSMVGAMIVSSIRTQWDSKMPQQGNFREQFIDPVHFKLGDEMGMFTLGSTVIIVLPEGVGELSVLKPGQPLKLGEPIGRIYRD